LQSTAAGLLSETVRVVFRFRQSVYADSEKNGRVDSELIDSRRLQSTEREVQDQMIIGYIISCCY
jgi:hypothetical protein